MCVKNNYETTNISLKSFLYIILCLVYLLRWYLWMNNTKYGKDGKSYMPGCCLLYKLLIIFLNGFIKNLESWKNYHCTEVDVVSDGFVLHKKKKQFDLYWIIKNNSFYMQLIIQDYPFINIILNKNNVWVSSIISDLKKYMVKKMTYEKSLLNITQTQNF